MTVNKRRETKGFPSFLVHRVGLYFPGLKKLFRRFETLESKKDDVFPQKSVLLSKMLSSGILRHVDL
jgi:hypothetical protein